jgi:hypothetical protein
MWQAVIDQLLKALQSKPGQVGQPQFSPQQERAPQMAGVGMPRGQSAGLFDKYMQSNMMRRILRLRGSEHADAEPTCSTARRRTHGQFPAATGW